MNIYDKALLNGAEYEAACTSISKDEWDRLMEGAVKANRKKVVKIALAVGIIDEDQAQAELKHAYFNPYNHMKTATHLIYVHSGIEHFIRVY